MRGILISVLHVPNQPKYGTVNYPQHQLTVGQVLRETEGKHQANVKTTLWMIGDRLHKLIEL